MKRIEKGSENVSGSCGHLLLATAAEGEDQMQRVAALEIVVGGRLVVGPARPRRQYTKSKEQDEAKGALTFACRRR